MVSPINKEFVFGKLILGDYLIVIHGDTEKFLPTYYGNSFLWEEATLLQLRLSINDTIYMTNVPRLVGTDGGQVSGVVEADLQNNSSEEGGITVRRKLPNVVCYMRRFRSSGRGIKEQWELVAYEKTNEEGLFVFDDLPAGLYRFNVEYLCIPMDPNSFVEFEIGANGVEENLLKLEVLVTENGIKVTKVEELSFYRKYFKDLNVYPNPVDQVMKLSYSKLVSDQVEMALVDLTGKVIYREVMERGYNQTYQLDTKDLPDGFYILNFVDMSKADRVVTPMKVLVKHK